MAGSKAASHRIGTDLQNAVGYYRLAVESRSTREGVVFTISMTALPSRTVATIRHDPVPEFGEILANGGEWRGEIRGFRTVIETDDAYR